ncbi:unnamed protein product [Bemisia tabaci]|uniref:Uncharacterized protein n=1 Tax=Bemisia tabaci TaxID=7038 RepID=A0A9P0F2L6_BEMTA|nr:unnamed protein product [Bemisia tabaci]
MIPIFFACDHYNYARYLVVYFLTLLNLKNSHPGAEELLRNNGFSVNRSAIPGSRNAVDITIEQTINRSAKCSGGIIGFSRNFWAYTRWCVTRHERAKYVEVLMEKTDIQHSSDSAHRDLKSSQIKLSEESIRKVIEAFGQFFNPFEVETKEDLFCLSSGRPLPRTVDVRLLKINEIGQSDFSNFIQDRMITKEISFHDPIKRNNIKTFKVLQEKRTVSTTQNKLVEIRAERNLFGRILLLSQNHELNLEEILSYSLSPIPWALATADGASPQIPPPEEHGWKLLNNGALDFEWVSGEIMPRNLIDLLDSTDESEELNSDVDEPPEFENLEDEIFADLEEDDD